MRITAAQMFPRSMDGMTYPAATGEKTSFLARVMDTAEARGWVMKNMNREKKARRSGRGTLFLLSSSSAIARLSASKPRAPAAESANIHEGDDHLGLHERSKSGRAPSHRKGFTPKFLRTINK